MEGIVIRKNRIILENLNPQEFYHPQDWLYLEKVKSVKGFDFLVTKFFEYGIEKIFYVMNITDNIKISHEQFPELYNIFLEACKILEVTPPEFYINQNPVVNAYTTGVEKPFVCVTSGLIELMTEDEIMAIIGHELGHIKCGHVLYQMMARCLKILMEIVSSVTLGIGKFVGMGLELTLLEWSRKAELSADRAGLLVVQDPDVMMNALMKIAGGASSHLTKINRDAIIKQAIEAQAIDEKDDVKGYIERAGKFLINIFRSHPFPIIRTKEIYEWSKGSEYERVLRRETRVSDDNDVIFCPRCGTKNLKVFTFCEKCGLKLWD
jgi:Zn-dependent protease with chaperone function